MTLVVDSSTVVAGLVDSGPDGSWADELLASDGLAAPHLVPVEAANVLRRAAHAGQISADAASLAHGDLLALRVELFPYEPFAGRAWALRENLTAFDGWYVALAEALDAPLATLDARLARADGPRCAFALPGWRGPPPRRSTSEWPPGRRSSWSDPWRRYFARSGRGEPTPDGRPRSPIGRFPTGRKLPGLALPEGPLTERSGRCLPH